MREKCFRNPAAALLLVDDRLTQLDTFPTDEYIPGAFDQRADISVTLATEGAIGVSISPGIPGRTPSARSQSRIFVRHAVSLVWPSCLSIVKLGRTFHRLACDWIKCLACSR